MLNVLPCHLIIHAHIYFYCIGNTEEPNYIDNMSKIEKTRLKALKLALRLTKVDAPMLGTYIQITRQLEPQEMIEAAKLFEAYLNG